MLDRNLKILTDFAKTIMEKTIVVNNNDLIVFANHCFLESINLKFEDVFNKNYKAILSYDIALNKHYIFTGEKKLYSQKINLLDKESNYEILIFKDKCGSLDDGSLVDSSIIFDSIPDILSVNDIDDTVLYYNKAGYDFLELTEDETIGKKCYNLIGKKIKCSECPASESIKTGNLTQKIRFFPEFEKWIDIRAYPIKNKSGEVIQVIEHLRDITEQKLIEQKYKDTEVQLGLLMENIPGIVYRCKNDLNWTMLFMSKETKKLTGYEPEEFINNRSITYENIIHPDDKQKVRKTVFSSIKNKKNFIVEYRITSKKGVIKHVWEKGKVYTDEYNNEFIDGVILDITARKRFETDLKINEEKYRLLIENQNELIIKLDKYGRFKYVNDRFCKYFGKNVNELLNKNFMPVVHEEDKHETGVKFARLKQYPHTSYVEHRAMTINGWRWLAWSNKAIVNKYDEIVEIISVGRDITDKKIIEYELVKAKEKAEKSDQIKTTFLYNVSEKINKPLNELAQTIRNNNYLCVDTDLNNRIQSTINELHDFIGKLDEISKIETGQISVKSENFDLNLLIEDVISKIKNTYSHKNIDLTLKKEIQESFIIFNDKLKIKQIFIHLLSNAFKFTESGSVEFGYKIVDNNVNFYINDTGVGIDEESIKLLFVLSDNTRNKGFGIPIVKAYVDILGGTMNIESKLGQGTNVDICLPVESRAYNKKESSIKNQEILDLNSSVILVAEDERINFQLLKTILTKAGATILRAKTGTEAINIVRERKDLTLVLMDIKMPGISGAEALIEIRKINPDLKVIACTAYTQSDDSDSFSKNEFDGFLPKPIKRKELFKTIKEIL